jgi:hypothetical protein
MRKYLICILILCLLVPQAALQAQKREYRADLITAAQLKDYLSFVASDLMEGRNTPSRGLDITAHFIATLLSRWDVKPGGENGTYFQTIVLTREGPDVAACQAEINGQKFTYGADFLPAGGSGIASGPLVYVGDGWLIKSKNIDGFGNLDVKGKIIVAHYNRMGTPPRGLRFADLEGLEGKEWANVENQAKEKGATGIIYIASRQSLTRWTQMGERMGSGGLMMERFATERRQADSNERLPAIVISERMARALFDSEPSDANAVYAGFPQGTPVASFAMKPEKQAKFTVKTGTQRVNTQNVIGLIEGSDPVLKKEYVAVSAHYDHVGMSSGEGEGDRIFNGADDDGSGTVAVLAIAEAMSKASIKPKRSVLFIWHAGEEHGLWGSRYYTTYPTVPLDRMAALLNIDMIGRSKQSGDTKEVNANLSEPNEVYVIGSKRLSTELGDLVEKVNDRYLKLKLNYKYDAPNDPERFYFRSDHYMYAQKGVPIAFYFTGVHEDYHQLSDHVEKIDFVKMERVARTIYITLWELAELKQRPKVDGKTEGQN